MQVIFGELFQLPCPPHIDIMYTTLLIELCKLQPGSLPQVVSSIVPAVHVQDALKQTEVILMSVLHMEDAATTVPPLRAAVNHDMNYPSLIASNTVIRTTIV